MALDASSSADAAVGVEEVTDRGASMTPTTAPAVIVPSAPAVTVSSAPKQMITAGEGTMTPAITSNSAIAGLPRKNAGTNVSRGGEGRELPSETFIRTLSGSRLNAEAPEFVPKGIAPLTVPDSMPVPRLVSGSSLPIPGVLPVQFVDSLMAGSQGDPLHSMVPAAPSVSTSAATNFIPAEMDEGLLVQESSPPHAHPATASPPAPHSKPANNDELRAKIVKQVEFYFSDQNLPTDNYLMKFVKKDPDGFVPIHVMASFRRVKNLSKNHAAIASALRSSAALVVSEDGKKVRRARPLPDIDLEEVQTRTVVAENLPADHSIESMEQLFSAIGTVKMVRICQPEGANGATQTAAKFKSDMVICNKVHALVEFETVEQAEKAVVALSDQGNWRSGLRVRLLLRRTFQGKHGFQKSRKIGVDDSSEVEETAGAEDRIGDEFNQHHEETLGHDGAGTNERDMGGKRGKGRGRGRGASGRGKGQHGGPHHLGSNGSRIHQPGTSPQVTHNLITSEVVGRLPPGPRMPDGTRGFTLGRGKVPVVDFA